MKLTQSSLLLIGLFQLSACNKVDFQNISIPSNESLKAETPDLPPLVDETPISQFPEIVNPVSFKTLTCSLQMNGSTLSIAGSFYPANESYCLDYLKIAAHNNSRRMNASNSSLYMTSSDPTVPQQKISFDTINANPFFYNHSATCDFKDANGLTHGGYIIASNDPKYSYARCAEICAFQVQKNKISVGEKSTCVVTDFDMNSDHSVRLNEQVKIVEPAAWQAVIFAD